MKLFCDRCYNCVFFLLLLIVFLFPFEYLMFYHLCFLVQVQFKLFFLLLSKICLFVNVHCECVFTAIWISTEIYKMFFVSYVFFSFVLLAQNFFKYHEKRYVTKFHVENFRTIWILSLFFFFSLICYSFFSCVSIVIYFRLGEMKTIIFFLI